MSAIVVFSRSCGLRFDTNPLSICPSLILTGKMINPHNPEFITKRPWYLGESGPSLVHHSKQKVDEVLTMKKADEIVHQRWASKKKAATGYRKVGCSFPLS